ncbi:MAG: hypothetical protein ABFS45_01285 [Pseudomonadota bacterium]
MPFFHWMALGLSCAYFLCLPGYAEVLNLPDQDPAVVQMSDAPTRGMTKKQVRSTYGEPLNQNSAVGNPPIARWEYANYTVYFEDDYVLHTVVRHQK